MTRATTAPDDNHRGDNEDDDDMTTTPTEAQEAPAEQTAGRQGDAAHRHRTARHVVWHSGAAGSVSAAAGVLHAFGPAGLGVGAGVGAVIAGGTVALRRAGKGRTRRSSARPAPRVRSRATRTATGSRTAAGLRRDPAATGRTVSRRTATARPGRTGTPRATGAPRRTAGLRRGQVADRTRRTSGGRGVATTRRRQRPVSTAPSSRAARAAKSSTRRGRTAPASRLSRPGGSTPATRTARAAATRAKTRRAAASRPTPRHAAPAKTAPTKTTTKAPTTARRPSSTVHARKVAKIVRRQAIRGGKFVAAGAKGTKPYLRLRPPATETAIETTKKTPATTAAAKKTIASKPGARVRRPATKRPDTRPGRAITAPGNERETVSDLNIPSGGMAAVMDAIDEHIGGVEFENATDIFGALAGLEGVCSHLGMALSNMADRLRSDSPIDAAVADHVGEMGGMAITLSQWGTQAHHLARTAHESDLSRLDNPRRREEMFDVDHNR